MTSGSRRNSSRITVTEYTGRELRAPPRLTGRAARPALDRPLRCCEACRIVRRALLTLTLPLIAALIFPACTKDASPLDAGVQDLSRPDLVAAIVGDLPLDASPDATIPLDRAVTPDGSGEGPLRVATFNCHCLLDAPSTRAKGIALQIVKLDPDVVGLQEVCQTASSPADNFAQAIVVELKALSGKDWQTTFTKTHLSWTTYDEGVGLLAPKGTIVSSGEVSLPQGQGPFPRKVVWARLATSRGGIYVYNTHLTISSDPDDRLSQVTAILALVNQHLGANLPQVVVGDFNDWYGSSAVSQMKSGPPAFTEAWGTKHPGSTDPGLTCCYPTFQYRIDYVFVRSAALSSLDQVELAFDQPYSAVQLSDHRGLFVEFSAK